MIRKTFVMAVAAVALSLAADSAWACKFLDNACCRCRRTCNWTFFGCRIQPSDCCVLPVCTPPACSTVTGGETTILQGTLMIEPSPTPTETPQPVVDKPTEPTLPPVNEKPVEVMPAEKPVEPKPSVPPVVEEPKAPTPPAEPSIFDEPIKPEPPKEVAPEPVKPEPPAEKPAEPVKPLETLPTEPETDAFGNLTEPAKKAEEPKTEEPKEEPKVETPKEPEKPAAPEKKSDEEPDPFGKNDAKSYRLWTDASGEFTVEARFVGFVDGKVRLQKANGRYVRIVMNQLCDADQRLLRHIETLAKN